MDQGKHLIFRNLKFSNDWLHYIEYLLNKNVFMHSISSTYIYIYTSHVHTLYHVHMTNGYRFFFVISTLKILCSVSCLHCRVLRRRNIKSIRCNKRFYTLVSYKISFDHGFSKRKFAGKCYITKLAVMKRN